MRLSDEPHENIGGVWIHIGARSMVDGLLASGHTVELNQDGELAVTPLDEDIVLLLSLGESRIH